MSVFTEIQTIETFIKTKFPASKTGKQTVPKKPVRDTFYIRFLGDERETETRYHYRADREYQIVYVAQWPEDIIPKMDSLADSLYQTERIAPGIRVDTFSCGQPFELEGGDYATIGILTVAVRTPRSIPTPEIMQNITISQTLRS